MTVSSSSLGRVDGRGGVQGDGGAAFAAAIEGAGAQECGGVVAAAGTHSLAPHLLLLLHLANLGRGQVHQEQTPHHLLLPGPPRPTPHDCHRHSSLRVGLLYQAPLL